MEEERWGVPWRQVGVASKWKEDNNASRGREEQTRKRMRLAAARG
jgi:hypothetical protein